MKQKVTYPLLNIEENSQSYLQLHQSTLDRLGVGFSQLSSHSYWEPNNDTYYLCSSDQTLIRSKLGDTQLNTRSTDLPFIPWSWEPFDLTNKLCKLLS